MHLSILFAAAFSIIGVSATLDSSLPTLPCSLYASGPNINPCEGAVCCSTGSSTENLFILGCTGGDASDYNSEPTPCGAGQVCKYDQATGDPVCAAK
jgi:hypothetical protein